MKTYDVTSKSKVDFKYLTTYVHLFTANSIDYNGTKYVISKNTLVYSSSYFKKGEKTKIKCEADGNPAPPLIIEERVAGNWLVVANGSGDILLSYET